MKEETIHQYHAVRMDFVPLHLNWKGQMRNKIMAVIYIIGLILSAAVGFWHFTVPYLYKWHSYIPNEYRNLIVSIDYINFFFSLLLSGNSLLLIIFMKKIFNGNKELCILYGFMVFVWLCRVVITFIEPIPPEPAAWPAYLQQISSFVIFLLLIIPFVYLLRRKKR